MLRSAASKVMWVGRATVFLVGLTVILALLFGAASTVSAHTGEKGFFHLGHKNVSGAVSKLVGKVAGPSLVIGNGSEDRRATALRLNVKAGKPPLKVNAAAGKATNLNADKLDDKEASDFYAAGSKVDDSAHADQADSATNAQDAADADKLDNKDSSDFAPKAVEGWREVGAANQPGLQNGWTNVGFGNSTAAFYKDPWGVVHLKGLVRDGTVPGVIFELPCGYGLSQDESHSVLSNNTVGRVAIRPWNSCGNGQFTARVLAMSPSNNAYVALDGITFRAAGS